MDEEEIEFTAEMEKRMYEPLEWDSPAICKIQDLQEAQYDEALQLIKHHFFREEPMCKAIFLLQDKKSVNGFLHFIRIWMMDTTSLVALSVASGRVIGVAILRYNSDSDRTDAYARVQTYEGDALRKIMHLLNTLVTQVNVYKELKCDMYLRIHILCVHPSYQERGIDIALLKTCMEVAATLSIPAVGGIFTSGASQMTAENLGFRLISEIRYGRWVVDNEIVFDDPGRGNYSAAFMALRIEPEEAVDETDNNNENYRLSIN